MDFDDYKLNPGVISLLKRRRALGRAFLTTSIFFAFGGIFVTHEINEFGWAVVTFFGALALGVFGIYHLSRSAIPTRKPIRAVAWLIIVVSLASAGLILWYSWERFFSRRDDDAGLAFAVIALEFILIAVFQYFVLSNHKKGVYRQMLDTDENLK